MDGKKLVEAAKWAKEHPDSSCADGCPLKNNQDQCAIGCLVCHACDAILAAYEWGKKECKARARKWAKHYAEQYADRFAGEFQKAWVDRILKAMDGEVKDAGVY